MKIKQVLRNILLFTKRMLQYMGAYLYYRVTIFEYAEARGCCLSEAVYRREWKRSKTKFGL